MKKIIFLLLITFTSKAQDLHTEVFKNGTKSMIGLSKEKVQEYWEDKVSSFTFKDFGANRFVIIEDGSFKSEFGATFENGKCTEQELLLHDQNVTVFVAKIQKQGFFLDKAIKAYINKTAGLQWTLEQEHSGSEAYDYWNATLSKIQKQ